MVTNNQSLIFTMHNLFNINFVFNDTIFSSTKKMLTFIVPKIRKIKPIVLYEINLSINV